NADLNFDVPADWQDRTIVAFAGPAKPGRALAPNLVLTRDPAGDKESVASYADRQLVEFAKRLEDFDLQDRRERTLGGLPAVEFEFTWYNPLGVLRQRQVCVLLGKRTVFNFTLSALEEDFPGLEPAFNTILTSVRFPEVPDRAAGGTNRAR